MSRVGDAPSIAVASRAGGAGGDGVEEEVAVGGGRGVEGGGGEAEEEEAGAELVDLPLELLRLAGLIVTLLAGPGVLLVVPFLARMAPHLRSSSKRRPTSPPRYQGSLFRAAVAARTGGG